ncbi:sensor histidine kinase [Sphingomonas crusticola]|uniref:sensor histidine kinase n=1 Tax=Sphingomonas crusticola TaxID=1697973 RepID=UPI001F084614|nr:HWE histidine kinase domain-containing protein [Sphingomonas crusticola]
MSARTNAAIAPFPVGGGELGALIAAFDWSKTSLGPIGNWPQSLKTVTNLLLLSPVPIVLLWNEDGVMIYNDAYSEFAGRRHPQLLGSKVREGWPEVADFNDNVMKVGLAGGTLAYRAQELTLERHGAPAPAWMNLDYSPVVDESGEPAGVIAIVVEITEAILAERAMIASEGRFRALVNASSDVIYRMTPDWSTMHPIDGRGLVANNDSPNPQWLEENLYAEDHVAVRAAIDDAIRRKGTFEMEHRVRRPDGSTGWTFSRAVPILDDTGAITEWFGTATDVTERHRSEDHLRLVVNELNHRVKNSLAMTQAIAAQTFRGADDLAQAQARFSERIRALAQANDLLTGERGAGVSLHGAVEQAVRPHCGREDRLRIEGPNVSLSPKTALSLSLAMHELATNALKHGAWSAERGEVAISWRTYTPATGGARVAMLWRESGGPRVAPPARRGFGSRLIERGLSAEMGGEVHMRFEPDGLVCEIDAPLTIYGLAP